MSDNNKKKGILEKFGIVEKLNFFDPVEDNTSISDKNLNENNINQRFSNDEPMFKSDANNSASEAEETHTYRQNEPNKESFMKSEELCFSDITRIYDSNNLHENGIDTVFIIDEYAKVLPDSLPADLRRQTVRNILETTKLNVNILLKDGKTRVQILSSYMESFSHKANELVTTNEREIRDLEQEIARKRNEIEQHRILYEKQQSTVEYEINRINQIIASYE